ncbi:MerR family transcriptional regulator [Micromonospora sp. NBC_01813]|uniref:MerR family transcriptional regulator n=1 Tax=Micromonospora sp. NBC_01813 TaxID=2975988 RepID=UPI002DD892B5|nr:MerR family transcriptional regulator [Micromonospora sp. NBC_01813]WSA11166.1 MerR family transcriptional regulator [Micromonospora sp. NBC_01813]
MLIGELAQRAATSARMLRYYEAQGLVCPRRCANGYRDYDDTELRVVEEIRSLLAAGFDLDDIRPFVTCLRAGNPTGDVCPDSISVLSRKLTEVDAALQRLTTVREQLRRQLDRTRTHRRRQ